VPRRGGRRLSVDNPYTAPASRVRDLGDRPLLSPAGRILLWVAFAGNVLMAAAAIPSLFAAAMEGDFYWAGAFRTALAALSIAALFKRTGALLFWLSVLFNAMSAVLVALNVVLVIRLRDGMAPEAAVLAQSSMLRSAPVALLWLLTIVVVVTNRGKA